MLKQILAWLKRLLPIAVALAPAVNSTKACAKPVAKAARRRKSRRKRG